MPRIDVTDFTDRRRRYVLLPPRTWGDTLRAWAWIVAAGLFAGVGIYAAEHGNVAASVGLMAGAITLAHCGGRMDR